MQLPRNLMTIRGARFGPKEVRYAINLFNFCATFEINCSFRELVMVLNSTQFIKCNRLCLPVPYMSNLCMSKQKQQDIGNKMQNISFANCEKC